MAIPFIKEVGAVMETPESDEVEAECDACGELKPEKGGEGIVAYTHRVDGQAVGVDREWICAQCVALRDDHFEEPDYDYYPPEYDHRYYEEK